jgi:hypothetical protein
MNNERFSLNLIKITQFKLFVDELDEELEDNQVIVERVVDSWEYDWNTSTSVNKTIKVKNKTSDCSSNFENL